MKKKAVVRKRRSVPLIVIGANKETIAAATKSILAIIAVSADASVLVSALETLRTLCHVTNTTISNCHIEG